MPLQYKSETPPHAGLGPHAASARSSVRSDGSIGRKAAHWVSTVRGQVKVSHAIEPMAWLPWQKEGATQVVASHGGGGGEDGGGCNGFSKTHATDEATWPPPVHSA